MAARIVDALSHPSARGKVDGKREDDTTSRWLVQKRTYFKGSYDRVLTVSSSAIGTQMPNLQGTNLYTLAPEFNIKAVTFEKDCLTVNAKPDAKVCVSCCYVGPALVRTVTILPEPNKHCARLLHRNQLEPAAQKIPARKRQ